MKKGRQVNLSHIYALIFPVSVREHPAGGISEALEVLLLMLTVRESVNKDDLAVVFPGDLKNVLGGLDILLHKLPNVGVARSSHSASYSIVDNDLASAFSHSLAELFRHHGVYLSIVAFEVHLSI